MEKALNTLEDILDEHIRPMLNEHGGDVLIKSYEDGVLTLKLQGQCLSCASSDFTTEYIEQELKRLLPEIKEIYFDQSVSEELLAMAREILSKGRQS